MLLLVWALVLFVSTRSNAVAYGSWITGSYIGEDGTQTRFMREQWSQKELSEDFGIVSKECMLYLEKFSNSTSKFINCTVVNARPLHYCEYCVGDYQSVNNIYQIIFDSDDFNNQSVDCKKEILRADNIQIVLLTYNFIQSVWKKSKCDRCFAISERNGTKRYRPANSTVKLLRMIDKTLQCFNDLGASAVSQRNRSDVCDYCRLFYYQANSYYEEMESKNMLCSDLIDSMNYTRLEWGQKYNCTIALKDRGEIWGITAFVFLLPLLFYVGLWIHANPPMFLLPSNRHRRLSNSG